MREAPSDAEAAGSVVPVPGGAPSCGPEMCPHFIRSNRPRVVATLALSFLSLASGWIVFSGLAGKPPIAELAVAREAVSAARWEGAAVYAPGMMAIAEAQWETALFVLARENACWRPFRDYDGARLQARDAARKGIAALHETRSVRDSLEWIAATGLPIVRDQLETISIQLARTSSNTATYRSAAALSALVGEGERAFERRDFAKAAATVQLAAVETRAFGVDLARSMSEYLGDLPLWTRWHGEAVEASKTGAGAAIVIDKMAHRLYVYRKGRLQHSFDVDLGPSWMGPKRHEGDASTPEGRYRVLRKRESPETVYFRALDIDYPNEEDRRRFEAARRSGTLPVGVRIGGRIEIHGEGGRGVNWTDGCVALHNADMLVLFDEIPTGTPVTIVGALEIPQFAADVVSVFSATGSLDVSPAHDDDVR